MGEGIARFAGAQRPKNGETRMSGATLAQEPRGAP